MHASLGGLSTDDLSTVVAKAGVEGDRYYMRLDFSEGVADTALMNMVEKLVENIARIKDHLKVWCQQNGKPFHGEAVIDSTLPTKLVHDLWNTQKHGVLKSVGRSGIKPQLVELRRGMRLSTGGEAGSSTVMTIGRDGRPVVHMTGGGKAELVVDGEIVDEKGQRIAGFIDTCAAAVTTWEQALAAAGVPLPKP